MLAEFCAQTGITRATLVGNSMGGWVALAFAVQHPEKVERLVLVNSTGYSQKRWKGPAVTREDLLRFNPATLSAMRTLLLSMFANKALVTDQAVKAAFTQKLAAGDSDVINAFIESVMRDEDYIDEGVRNLAIPTLLLWGRNDAVVPLAVAEAFRDDIKGSTLKLLDNCGHVPMLECFGPFNTALVEGLKGAVR
jgi:pimeloyl-ACP methyl ester carboxylesterase